MYTTTTVLLLGKGEEKEDELCVCLAKFCKAQYIMTFYKLSIAVTK